MEMDLQETKSDIPKILELRQRAQYLAQTNLQYFSNAAFLQRLSEIKRNTDGRRQGPTQESIYQAEAAKLRCLRLSEQIEKLQSTLSTPMEEDKPKKILELEERERQLMREIAVQKRGWSYDANHHTDEAVKDRLKQEFVDLLKGLEEALAVTRQSAVSQSALIAREEQIIAEHKDIQKGLKQKLEALQREPAAAPSAVEVELQKKLSMMREKNKWLMQALASFIDAHYPPIARQKKKQRRVEGFLKKEGKPKEDEEPMYVSLKTMLQELMNLCVSHPHDPYLRLNERHYPPYVELLLRAGVAEKHPTNSNLLKLTPFHK